MKISTRLWLGIAALKNIALVELKNLMGARVKYFGVI